MVVEVSTPDFPSEPRQSRHFERRKPYSCRVEGHVFGPWEPRSQTVKYRVCVIPECHHFEDKKVTV